MRFTVSYLHLFTLAGAVAVAAAAAATLANENKQCCLISALRTRYPDQEKFDTTAYETCGSLQTQPQNWPAPYRYGGKADEWTALCVTPGSAASIAIVASSGLTVRCFNHYNPTDGPGGSCKD